MRPPCPLGRLGRGLLAALLLVACLLVAPARSWAGPVEWHEVPATAEGRQWWDAGSLRLDREGRLSVLSRFQPEEGATTLYVMQLDCDEQLFRDTSVNGLPRFRAEWQAVAEDALGASVIQEACAAWAARPLP
jgi:hypothetical protein